mmetsp:Transcript_4994/g.3621  ORF Transcript_4994/g.3621 Transcript_4994/m.3621 type:complete len:240 (+) Transcript_4994:558-1277(+)
MFYALTEKEAYFAEKVSIFIALGPVTTLAHCRSTLLNIIANNDELLIDFCEAFGIYEFFPANWIDSALFGLVCGLLPPICEFGVQIFADEDTSLDDSTRLNVYMGHFPSGTSLKCLDHYAQSIQTDAFRRYDYGGSDNMIIYGQENAPDIDLTKLKGDVPIAMFVGQKDELATTIDNEWAYSQMTDAVIFYNEYNLGHLSFMVAKDMSYFTVDALYLLKTYSPKIHISPNNSGDYQKFA